ncbi:acetylglutamate kinase [Chloroflexota bacterium]
MDKVTVVKIGGATFGSHDTTIDDIVTLQQQGKLLVVVHGGGKLISQWLGKMGVPTKMVNGERVTDVTALEVVTAVLSGLVNKDIVSAINCRGGRSVGISGVDGALVQCKIKNEEMGYVGNIVKVDVAILETLLKSGYVPVVSPVSLDIFGMPGDIPQLLNVNGDPVAGEIAATIGAEKLIFMTDVAGICDQSGKLISNLSGSEAKALVASGVASGGMVPKVEACLKALSSTQATCIIDGRRSHALLAEIQGRGTGTIIRGA